jgi:integrase/recombinase XerD
VTSERPSGALRLLAATPPVEAPSAEARRAYERQLVADFITSRRATASYSTVRSTMSALRANLLPWLDERGVAVCEVTAGDLDAWALALKHSVRTRTHQQYFAQVELFYDWLVTRRSAEIEHRFGVRVENPVDRFNRARRLGAEERFVPLPREEAIAYFLACSRARISSAVTDGRWLRACRDYALWMVFNWAGLRRMEASALTIADVDLVAGTLRVVEGKGGKGRIVHLQPQLGPVLRWYVHEVLAQTDGRRRDLPLFTSTRQRAMHPMTIANLLHERQVDAGLPEDERFTCHGFRRAYATRLYKTLRAEAFRDPLVYVKEQLGHQYLSTTERYCQLDDDYRFFLAAEATAALTRHYEGGARDD